MTEAQTDIVCAFTYTIVCQRQRTWAQMALSEAICSTLTHFARTHFQKLPQGKCPCHVGTQHVSDALSNPACHSQAVSCCLRLSPCFADGLISYMRTDSPTLDENLARKISDTVAAVFGDEFVADALRLYK